MKFYAFNKVHFVGIVPRIPTKEDEDFLYEAMVDLEGNYIPEFTENILNYTLVPENEVLEYIRDNVFDKFPIIKYGFNFKFSEEYRVAENIGYKLNLYIEGSNLYDTLYESLTTKELLEAIYVTRDIKVYKEVEL